MSADTLGNSLAQLLQRATGASASDGRLITILEVEIIDFKNDEIIQLIDLMRNEFPGFEKLGIEPVSMVSVLPEYLWPFRVSGQFAEIKSSAKNLKS